jgi:hypothetical protein
MSLTREQRTELEGLTPTTVRLMLLQGGPGRGAAISGFKCGDITKGDIDDWLIEKSVEETAIQRGTLRWAKIAGLAGIISVVVTVIMGTLAIYLAK